MSVSETQSLLAPEASPNSEEAPTTPPVSPDPESGEANEQPAQADPATEPETPPETPPEGAPESYEFSAPEGTEIESKVRDTYAEVARELDLPQEKAQAMFDKTVTALNEAAMAGHAKQNEEWLQAVKDDPDIGGEKLERNLSHAAKARAEFGSEGLDDLLRTPLGNHPDVVRLLVKVGKALGEDNFVAGDKSQSKDTSPAGRAARMYPSSHG